MALPIGIYRINKSNAYVVGVEKGGMFYTSETLDLEDVEDLIIGEMDLADYALSSERERAITEFAYVPEEKWAEIAGTEVEETT